MCWGAVHDKIRGWWAELWAWGGFSCKLLKDEWICHLSWFIARRHGACDGRVWHLCRSCDACHEFVTEEILTRWVLAGGVSVGAVDDGELHQLPLLQLVLTVALKSIKNESSWPWITKRFRVVERICLIWELSERANVSQCPVRRLNVYFVRSKVRVTSSTLLTAAAPVEMLTNEQTISIWNTWNLSKILVFAVLITLLLPAFIFPFLQLISSLNVETQN